MVQIFNQRFLAHLLKIGAKFAAFLYFMLIKILPGFYKYPIPILQF